MLGKPPDVLPPGAGLWTLTDRATVVSNRATASHDMLFYHGDHLGSSGALTDLSGALVEEFSFYPHGSVRHEDGRTTWFHTAYQYTGKERDQESGLHYYGARYYDAAVGTFIGSDPLYTKSAYSIEDELHTLLESPQLVSVAERPM